MFNEKLFLNPEFFSDTSEISSIREGFGLGLLDVGEDKKVVVVSADLSESVKADGFAKKYPERYVEVGVAEQNMAGIGAGLALGGKVPFITSFGVFNPMRNLDQVRVSICYSNLNVKILGSHAGFSNGRDGATHQALEDVAVTRVLPNMSVVCPCDALQMRKLIPIVRDHPGPIYIRSFREPTKVVTTDKTPLRFGKGQIFMEGKDITLISSGPIITNVLDAAKVLKDNYSINAEVINIHTIKPIDSELLIKSVEKTGRCVVIEEHQVSGGLGGLVCEVLAPFGKYPVEIIGVLDSFGGSGSYQELLSKYGLSANAIVEKVLKFC